MYWDEINHNFEQTGNQIHIFAVTSSCLPLIFFLSLLHARSFFSSSLPLSPSSSQTPTSTSMGRARRYLCDFSKVEANLNCRSSIVVHFPWNAFAFSLPRSLLLSFPSFLRFTVFSTSRFFVYPLWTLFLLWRTQCGWRFTEGTCEDFEREKRDDAESASWLHTIKGKSKRADRSIDIRRGRRILIVDKIAKLRVTRRGEGYHKRSSRVLLSHRIWLMCNARFRFRYCDKIRQGAPRWLKAKFIAWLR